MKFSEALDRMVGLRQKVTRMGWHGRGMWLQYVPKWMPINVFYEPETDKFDGFIAIHTTLDTFVPWTCSQADMLSNDWMVVP